MPFLCAKPPLRSPPCTSCCFFHYTGQRLLTASTYLISLLSYMIYVTETSHLSGSAHLSLFLIPRRALALWYNCTTGLFFFFFGVGRWWRWGVSMATGKLFRIICYLKTMRLFINSRGGGASARFIWNLLDVLQMFCTCSVQSEASEIFFGSPHADMLHCSATADVRLFQF